MVTEAELFLFSLAKDDRYNRASRPEWPELHPGYKQLFEVVLNSLIQVRHDGARRHAFLRELALFVIDDGEPAADLWF